MLAPDATLKSGEFAEMCKSGWYAGSVAGNGRFRSFGARWVWAIEKKNHKHRLIDCGEIDERKKCELSKNERKNVPSRFLKKNWKFWLKTALNIDFSRKLKEFMGMCRFVSWSTQWISCIGTWIRLAGQPATSQRVFKRAKKVRFGVLIKSETPKL